MKTIFSILGIAFVVIAVCMTLLVQKGVSLRTAPIIKQSLLAEDEMNIATGIVLRLYPDFQQAEYIVWNLDQNSSLIQKNMGVIKNRLEKELKKDITVIYDGENITPERLSRCAKPCWIFFKENTAHVFDEHPIFKQIAPLSSYYFTISWSDFKRDLPMSESCIKEQRLTQDCIKEVSVNEVRRKLKEAGRYFFMRKYQDHDYFFYLEKEIATL